MLFSTLLARRRRGGRRAALLRPDAADARQARRRPDRDPARGRRHRGRRDSSRRSPTATAPKLVHIIPNFHNPAGCTLSEAKRRRLVELSAEHGFWIFEDDPYREVRFGGEPLVTMLELAEGTDAKVVHASSFSKTVGPGVRVGYLIGPADEIKALAKGASETYISPNMLAESIVLELCRSGGLDRNIEFVNASLAERRDARRRSSSASRSPRPSSSSPAAATSSGSTSPRAPTRARCSRPAKDEGVAFVAGPDFMIEGGEQQHAPLLRPRPARRRRRGHRPPRPGARRVRCAPRRRPMRQSGTRRTRRCSGRVASRPVHGHSPKTISLRLMPRFVSASLQRS